MYNCPACHSNAIPTYRALLNFRGMKHDCPYCQTHLCMSTSSLGNLCLVASSCLSFPFASVIHAPPAVIILGGFVLPFVAGISLWLHTVKIEVAEQEAGFTPHTRELRF